MSGKPVYSIPVKTVINFKSGFAEKLLCDGPTFSTGDACAYTCSFCYVPSVMNQRLHMLKLAGDIPPDAQHLDSVIRRRDALNVMFGQLTTAKGARIARLNTDDQVGRVIYASPLVDVAANVELAKETAAACKMILELTPWHIRLLSKSNLLPLVAKEVGTAGRGRILYGVSTGTLDDKLAAAFEEGTPKVSKRIESLHRLQDDGQRTFGMICPSLPQRDYHAFAEASAAAIRADLCEHVWAEVINVRGESMTRTCSALRASDFAWEANELTRVSGNGDAWEAYSMRTFLAHASVPQLHGKLRFLQYVSARNIAAWTPHVPNGAVLLGKAAHG